MAKKKKKLSKRKQNILKKQRKLILYCLILIIIAIALLYFIFKSNLLVTKINQEAASFISFSNSDTTDMLKINSIKKLSDNQGKSRFNTNYLEFVVSSSTNTNYEIIIYPLNNKIDDKYIYYYLTDSNNKKIDYDNLSSKEVALDGGKIIYTSEINGKKKLKLKMWVNNKYKAGVKNIAYKVKVNAR